MSDTTQQALVVSEGLHAEAAADVRALLDRLAAELAGLGWRTTPPILLSAAAPRWAG